MSQTDETILTPTPMQAESALAGSPDENLPQRLMLGAVLLLGLVFAWPTLVALARVYRVDGNFSHGFIVPLISLYAAWTLRDRLLATRGHGHVFGFIPLGAGAVIILFSRWYEVSLLPRGVLGVFLAGFGLILVITGLCWLFLGWERVWILVFPLGFLFMALPLPGFILTGLTLPLQTIAAKIATACLRLIGISVVRKGNILELPNGALGVAEACSGIRSITVLFAVVLAIIFFNRLRKVPAIILLLAVPPVAIAANGIRVILSGILYYRGLKELASGGPHEFLGLLTFGLGIAILVGLAGLLTSLQLKASGQPSNVGGGVPTANEQEVPQNVGGTPNRSGRRSPSGDGAPTDMREARQIGCEGHTTGKPPGTGCVNTNRGSESQSSATPSLQTILASLDLARGRTIAVIAILLLAAATSHVVASHYDTMFRRELQAMGDRKSLKAFPERVGPYRRISTSELSDEEFDMLRPTEQVLATYVGPDGRLFPVTLLYWKPPRSEPSNRPDLLQRPHTPDECYPAAGWKRDWEFDSDKEYAWLPGELGSIRLYHRKGESQLLLFWLGLTFKRTLSPDQLLSRLKSMIQSWKYAPAANIHTITIMTDATGDPETAKREALEFSRTLAQILPDYGIGRRTEGKRGLAGRAAR